MKRIAAIVLTVSVGFAWAELFAGSYADTYGMSAKSMGMANAVTATVNDWSSLWYNPAGLGKTYSLPRYNKTAEKNQIAETKLKRGSNAITVEEAVASSEEFFPAELAVVVMYTAPMMNLQIPRTGVYAENELNFGTTTFGIVIDCNTLVKMPEIISSARFGIALGTGLDGWMYKINDTSPMSHNYLRYGREAQRTMILAGIGFGFFDDLFGIGVGANIQNRSEARSRVKDVLLSPDIQYPVAESKMTTYIAPFLTSGLYINPERITPVLKGLEIGMGYRMATEMKTHPYQSDSVMLVAGLTVPLSLAMFDYYTPHIISTGLAYTIFDVTTSLNLDYEMWSGFNLGPGYKKGVLYYTDPSNKDTSAYAKIPSMEDIIVYRLGISWDMKKWVSWLTLLGGYYYQPSFVPDSAVAGDMNFLDNDKHVLSFGAIFAFPKTWRFGGPVELSISYQYQYLTERSVHKTNLEATKGPPENYYKYNPDYKYGGMCHTVSMGAGIKI